MNKRIKQILITISFMFFIIGMMIGNIITPNKEQSLSERRILKAFPDFTGECLLNGAFFNDFEIYTQDQFLFRDDFRSINALSRYYGLRQKDNNEIYIINNGIYKLEYPLNEEAIIYATNKINQIYEDYLSDMNVNYAVIPDKNYFVADKHGYLSLNYDKLLSIMNKNLESIDYINLFPLLDISDYYRTDIHWRQDKILDVAGKLLDSMGNDVIRSEYKKHRMFPFYGSYYGQSALSMTPDELIYLKNVFIDEATVYDYEKEIYEDVYQAELFHGMDGYDIFLSGAKPLLTITNDNTNSDKELIIFRDSFGSSIAPLLIEGYSQIHLIDLRYISSSVLDKYIEFNNQDVLFLYSTTVLNNSWMLN